MPRRRLLDVRSSGERLLDAVRIPLVQLEDRISELPPPAVQISVAPTGEEAEAAVAALCTWGRNARLDSVPLKFGSCRPGRLWEPNPWLIEVIEGLPTGRGIDLGCGCGRESVAMVAMGWSVLGVDRLESSCRLAEHLADTYLDKKVRLNLQFSVADVLRWPVTERFDLALSCFWWHENLIGVVSEAVVPNGHLVVEAFSDQHKLRFGKPKRGTVASLAALCDLLPNFHLVRGEEGECRGRYTVRAHLQRH